MHRRANVIVGIFILCTTIFAQAPVSKPSFEVASVRPAAPLSPEANAAELQASIGFRGGPGTEDPGRLTCRFVTMLNLLLKAYGVFTFQIQGLPDWATDINSDRYDIVAQIPPGTTLEQSNLMLQNLLMERFGLVAHYVTRPGEIYELTIAKGGSKLREAAADPSPEPSLRAVDGRVLTGINEPFATLVRSIESSWRHLVVDTTGLTGRYDFSMPFIRPPGAATAFATPGDSASDPDMSSTLGSVLEQNLGIKLELKKAPLNTLVVDHVERVPTGN
jgi:uncharacterized protein (TIGR03435 family)